MGFLHWWQNNKPDEDSQLTLFGDSQELTPRKRVDGAMVNNEFKAAIKNAEGSFKVYSRAVEAETEELFDCATDELYAGTGGKRGDRSTLPISAQEAYLVNETLSKHRLNHDVKFDNAGKSQVARDEAIVEAVRDTAETVRKWLPW